MLDNQLLRDVVKIALAHLLEPIPDVLFHKLLFFVH